MLTPISQTPRLDRVDFQPFDPWAPVPSIDELARGIGQDVLNLLGFGPHAEQNPFSARSIPGQLWNEARAKAADPDRANAVWTPNRPLSEAVNAHSTNTVTDLKYALRSSHGYNWLEGDVRTGIDEKDHIEMRHEKAHEPGDNLSLKEWLEIGKASGKGLKLDIKEGEAINGVIATLKEVGVPQERLMLNLSDTDMAKSGVRLRREFPRATMAINPADSLPGKESGDGPYASWQVDRMIDQAKKVGAPVTFVLRADKVSPAIVKKLEALGSVSIWNEPFFGGLDDVEAKRAELKKWGVSGVIDLRKSYSTLEKIVHGGQLGLQYGAFYLEQGAQAAINGVEKAVGFGKKVFDGAKGLLGKVF